MGLGYENGQLITLYSLIFDFILKMSTINLIYLKHRLFFWEFNSARVITQNVRTTCIYGPILMCENNPIMDDIPNPKETGQREF